MSAEPVKTFRHSACGILKMQSLLSMPGPIVQKLRPLLEGGYMTEHTPELAVRATLQAGKVSLAEFVVQGDM